MKFNGEIAVKALVTIAIGAVTISFVWPPAIYLVLPTAAIITTIMVWVV